MPSGYSINDALRYRERVLEETNDAFSLADNFDVDNATIAEIQQWKVRVTEYIDAIRAEIPCEDGVESLARYGANDGDQAEDIECNCESDHSECYDPDDVVISVNDSTEAITEAGYVSQLKMSQRIEQIRQLEGKYQEKALAVLAHQLRENEIRPDEFWGNNLFNRDEFDNATILFGPGRLS